MMASPGLQTLPVKMWTTLRQDLMPSLLGNSNFLKHKAQGNAVAV